MSLAAEIEGGMTAQNREFSSSQQGISVADQRQLDEREQLSHR
jgi:hypothetical protein